MMDCPQCNKKMYEAKEESTGSIRYGRIQRWHCGNCGYAIEIQPREDAASNDLIIGFPPRVKIGAMD